MADDSAWREFNKLLLAYRPRPCSIPADELHPIRISKMQLGAHHAGKRTVILVTRPATRSGGALTAMVTDQDGSVARVRLDACCHPLEEVVPGKHVLRLENWYLIKEPMPLRDPDGKPHLVVGHPGDISWLPDDHEFIAAGFRNMDRKASLRRNGKLLIKGKEAISDEAWAEAEYLYSTAIEVAQTAQETRPAYLNRSLVNLKLMRPATALADAIKSIETATSAPFEKGLLREAAALYHLARFEQCLDKLQKITESFPGNKYAPSEIDRVRARLNEQQTGQYNFKRMYKQAEAVQPSIDCATYTMPVEIKDSPGKGLGVFTKKKVLAGELLVCEKAFGYVCKDRDGREPLTDEDAKGELLTQVVQKLFHNIEDARMFAELYNGDRDGVIPVDKVDGKPVIDSSIVRRVLDLTSSWSPRTSRSSFIEFIRRGMRPGDEHPSAIGVWSFNSHVNHSCISNTSASYIGDMQILRATKDLEEGTEILISYQDLLSGERYDDTQERLSTWGFKCNCDLCRDRQETPDMVLTHYMRNLAYEQIDGLFLNSSELELVDTVRAQQLLGELDQTYPPAAKKPGGVRLEFGRFCVALAREYFYTPNPARAIDMILEGLGALGFVISARPRRGDMVGEPALRVLQWGLAQASSFEAFRGLFHSCKMAAPNNAAAARGYMGLMYKMIVGESETMQEIFPE